MSLCVVVFIHRPTLDSLDGLCSPGPMFPSLYETGEHRNLFFKKGPMFPAFPKKGPMFPDMYVYGNIGPFF